MTCCDFADEPISDVLHTVKLVSKLYDLFVSCVAFT